MPPPPIAKTRSSKSAFEFEVQSVLRSNEKIRLTYRRFSPANIATQMNDEKNSEPTRALLQNQKFLDNLLRLV
jgi:hypothetical protein